MYVKHMFKSNYPTGSVLRNGYINTIGVEATELAAGGFIRIRAINSRNNPATGFIEVPTDDMIDLCWKILHQSGQLAGIELALNYAEADLQGVLQRDNLGVVPTLEDVRSAQLTLNQIAQVKEKLDRIGE